MEVTKARRMACPASVSWRASCSCSNCCDDHGSHQTDDHQLYASYLCLFLFSGQQVDVVCHIHHVDLQRLALVGQFEAVLQL